MALATFDAHFSCRSCVLTKQTVSALICTSGDWVPFSLDIAADCAAAKRKSCHSKIVRHRRLSARSGPYGIAGKIAGMQSFASGSLRSVKAYESPL
jgi:hypothetical protein